MIRFKCSELKIETHCDVSWRQGFCYSLSFCYNLFVLIDCITVSCGPRKRGGEVDSTMLNTRFFGWEAANRIFITFLLFAQQVVSGATSTRYPAFSNLYSFTRTPGIWVTIESQVPWLEVSWHIPAQRSNANRSDKRSF